MTDAFEMAAWPLAQGNVAVGTRPLQCYRKSNTSVVLKVPEASDWIGRQDVELGLVVEVHYCPRRKGVGGMEGWGFALYRLVFCYIRGLSSGLLAKNKQTN